MKISQVRNWRLSDLSDTATGLRNGANQLDQHALTIVNGMDGVSTNWEGEARDSYAVRVKGLAGESSQKSQRWNKAAGVLDKAAQQMGLLRNELLGKVDDPALKQKFDIADDGAVSINPAYAATLKSEQAKNDAEVFRSALEHTLRSLLATADVAGQQYDWLTTNALMGVADSDRPFTPQIPDHPTLPTKPKDDSNKDGSGPDQYNIDKPGFLDKAGLQGTRAWAETLVAGARGAGQQYAPDLLQHFLDGSGKPATVPVDNMLHDMSWFKQDSTAMARTNLDAAMRAMPPGYEGPVAFQSGYGSVDGNRARPDWSKNTDWFAALGSFSYQTSGVAMPNGNGTYDVSSQTNVYDYFNFDTTDPAWHPQVSDLNKLHRAGWAQNFETFGTSSPQRSTWP
ncbi:hypothetical protein P3F83_23540 [Mycobacteroides immunogenum]|uniref:hypothetical protein n=1 Tax=Mycobacteroides immunogenum TaxID=83262 RepID=UPI0025B77BF7|nr:hypothetical protein [Mycobacteroides immunogenum]WJR33385.1 hypothetical protein P3F83_23540 [Mycobacteroides immunogenum]